MYSFTVSPASFRVGDIVEIHFGIALVKGVNDMLAPKLLLRTIINLDNSFTVVRFLSLHPVLVR